MVPNKFLPSQLGEIPTDWSRVKFSDVMSARQGLQISISKRLKVPTKTSKEYITIQSIKKTEQVREYVEAPTKRVTCSKEDVLMTRTGNTGIVVTDVEGAFHNNFFLMDFDRQQVDRDFLVNYLRSNRVQHLILTKAGASTIPDLNHKDFYSIEFPLAPLPEQRKIAKILSTWDKAISTTVRLIDNSKRQKKALMQQLLTGKKRLLDDSCKPFEGEWEEVKLSHFFERVMEKNNGQSKNVVTISAQHGLIRQEEFFKKSVASETLDNYFILRKGQFAYNKSYSNGYPMGAIKRLNRYDDAVVTSLYICFELKDEQLASSCFMEQFFESGLLNRGLTKVAAEGGRAHGLLNVKPADFMALSMAVPKINEQQKIASALTNAEQEIDLLGKQLADLKQEKKALMQKLLTGKRRVKT
ncbi:restriction endonuclease subunit S [Moellerella wisconsensis]|uniref:restriction endonuclease subunit S n=1 Tax=Moellerella wisconsensis TaxID=158849 RepID=UPI003076517B